MTRPASQRSRSDRAPQSHRAQISKSASRSRQQHRRTHRTRAQSRKRTRAVSKRHEPPFIFRFLSYVRHRFMMGAFPRGRPVVGSGRASAENASTSKRGTGTPSTSTQRRARAEANASDIRDSAGQRSRSGGTRKSSAGTRKSSSKKAGDPSSDGKGRPAQPPSDSAKPARRRKARPLVAAVPDNDGAGMPQRAGFLSRLLGRGGEVPVEPMGTGISTAVLYAAEGVRKGGSRGGYAATHMISGRPRGEERRLVYRDSPFEVRVAGMQVRGFDRRLPGPAGDNELLLYSVRRGPPGPNGDQGEGVPCIHFDHTTDATATSGKPNTYVPTPASKSFVMGSGGRAERAPAEKSINVHFRIFELDKPDERVKQSIDQVGQLNGFVSGISSLAPVVGVLAPALTVAGALGKRALDSYAKPDKVMTVDMNFLLADRERARTGRAPPGEYLRFGYYFFLSEPVQSKLYASLQTPDNVQLMLRRMKKPGGANGAGSAPAFFPLTGVSYLVVRVAEPTFTGQTMRRPVQMSHARRLEEIFKEAKKGDDPKKVQKALRQLGKEIGVLRSKGLGGGGGSESSASAAVSR